MGLFDWISLGIDLIPGIGELKAVLELICNNSRRFK